jgi:two-component system, sensor histidine kinase and response regulator
MSASRVGRLSALLGRGSEKQLRRLKSLWPPTDNDGKVHCCALRRPREMACDDHTVSSTGVAIAGKGRYVGLAMISRLGRLRPARLVALLALLTLVPLVLLSFLSLRLATDAVRQEAKQRLRTSAGMSADLLSREVDHLTALVDSYARRPLLEQALARGRADAGVVGASLEELEGRPEIAAAFLADRGGRILDVRPFDPTLIGKDYSFRDWYRGVVRTKATYVSSAYASAAPGRPRVVAGVAPVRGPGRETVGYIVAAYGVAAVRTFVDRVEMANDVALTVTDQEGSLLAGPGVEPSRILTLSREPWVAEALAGRSGMVERDGAHGTVLSAYASVPGSGWAVAVHVPAAAALSRVSTLRAAVLPVAGGLGVVLVCGLAILFLVLRERSRMETTLRESEEENRSVIEAAKDAFVAMDEDCRITRWNSEAEAVFGWSREEALGRAVADTIVPSKYREAHTAGVDHFLATGEGPLLNQRIEIEATHRDGRVFPVELTIWSVRKNGGYSFNSFIHDITERKKLETARSHLAAIVESSDDAVLSSDLDGNVITWNRGAERLYGYSTEEMLGNSALVLTPPERRSETRELLARLKSGEKIEPFETERLKKDGTRVPVTLAISPIKDLDGVVTAASAIARDITSRVQAQEQLEAARAEAIEASRMKSEFLANMSHEIRTPMNGIIGMTDLLLTTQLSTEQEEFVRTIQASGDALLTLINDILDFSKIEAGKIELEEVDFDLRVAVEDSVELLAERAHAQGLEIATLTQPIVPPVVRGDPGRLRQVLVNLVSNAVKFTEEGEVVICVNVEEERDDIFLIRFQVSDTGIGIRPEERERLFQSFSQADASTTRRYGGTGLGLAISQQLVHLMGGEMGVHSEPGEGSTFWFTIPMAEGSGPARIDEDDAESLTGLCVLVVDDHATNRAMLELNLVNWGMYPASVSTAREAMTMLRDGVKKGNPYTIALVDFNMPEMDGIELARAIRSDPLLCDTRLVLLTSSHERARARDARDVGFDAYLTKPVRHTSLHGVLAAIVGGHEHAVPSSLVTRYSIAEAKARKRAHILVVEDNAVNQKVAARMLDKLGYRVDVASDGVEAIEAVQHTTYAAVLMDCQMPQMDGYEATQHIRKLEGPAARVPIIAMTAGAMKHHQDMALAAGMNDYMTKPVKANDLAAVLERWTKGSLGSVPPAESDGPTVEEAVDQDILSSLRTLGEQHPDGVEDLVSQFLATAQRSLAKLRGTVSEADGKEISFVAHSLKGIVATLGARRLAALLSDMEDMSSSTRLERAPELLAGIEAEFDRVCVEIHTPQPSRQASG